MSVSGGLTAVTDRDGTTEIVIAESDRHVEQARRLFVEYEHSLSIDLCFQDFEQELAGLPGEYAPPSGCILLAMDGDSAVGCVALRAMEGSACEMKRLYVDSAQRGTGLGRRLAESIIDRAHEIGYERMFLDTLAEMREAIGLYRSLGFRETDPYRFNPCEGATYMMLEL